MVQTKVRADRPGSKSNAKPFARLDHEIVASDKLSDKDVRLIAALLYYARDKDYCWPSDATLGEHIGAHRTTINRHLRYLEALKIIRRDKVPVTDKNHTGRHIYLTWRSGVAPRPQGGVAPQARGGVAAAAHKSAFG